MEKFKITFSVIFFIVFFVGCQGEINVDTLSFDSDEVEQEESQFIFGLPDSFHGDDSTIFSIELTKISGETALLSSDLTQSSFGGAFCNNINVLNSVGDSPSLQISDCVGSGNLTFTIGNKSSHPVLIDNLDDDQLASPFDLIVRNDGDIYLVDSSYDALYIVNLETSETIEVSGPNRGAGETFGGPASLVLNKNETKVYVLDNSKKAVIEVDPVSGNRTIISSLNSTVGTGNQFNNSTRLVLNNGEDKIYVCSRGGSRDILEVDITTGDRTVIASNSVGAGDSIDTPYGLAINTNDTKLYLMDRDTKNLYEVDIATGDRTLISQNSDISQGVSFGTPHGLQLTANEDVAYVNDTGKDALIKIDIATGFRSIVSSPQVGDGPSMISPLGITLNGDETKAYVGDAGITIDGVIEIDLVTGNRVYKTKKH